MRSECCWIWRRTRVTAMFPSRTSPSGRRSPKISGADRPVTEQIQPAPHQPGLSGRLPAGERPRRLYRRRNSPHHRGRPCAGGVLTVRRGGLSTGRAVSHHLRLGRAVSRDKPLSGQHHLTGYLGQRSGQRRRLLHLTTKAIPHKSHTTGTTLRYGFFH